MQTESKQATDFTVQTHKSTSTKLGQKGHFKVGGKVIIATFLCYGSYGHKFYFPQFMNKEEEDIKEIPKLKESEIILNI